jgi:DNA-binding response OmpR family regulator
MPGIEHLLVVDDDERICRLLSRYLQREGFRVDTAGDGRAMWEVLKRGHPDLIILDLVLPGVDGITLARELRAKTNIGIIMLTGKNEPVDTIVGLEVGADDYMTKPFDNRELLARIRSVLRRLGDSKSGAVSEVPEPDTGLLVFSGWQMKLDVFELVTPAGELAQIGPDTGLLVFSGWQMKLDVFELVTPAGELAQIGNHEFRLLKILVQNAGRALSRDQILLNLSRRGWQPDDRSVDVSIGKLRKLLEEDPAQPKMIRTIRGVGYQFTGKVETT